MARTPKENLILSVQVAQNTLNQPLPTKTKKDRELEKSVRLTNVALFNQHLVEAQALGLVVAAGDWPQPVADTGFGGVEQFICDWEDLAFRNSVLLNLLKKAADPATPAPAAP